MTTTTVPTVAERPYSETAYVNTKLAILACNTTLALAEETADILLRALARQADEFFPGRPPALSGDAFSSPRGLASALSRAAKAAGYEVDDTPKGLEALERVCAVALPVLIPETGGEAL